jgi:chorismate mutase
MEDRMIMYCRGIRGATTSEANTPDAILRATRELLGLLIEANDLDSADIGSVIFSTTPDLNAEFPALAARDLGWHDVALICTHEMAIPKALPKSQAEIKHVYIKGARALRPERGIELESAIV